MNEGIKSGEKKDFYKIYTKYDMKYKVKRCIREPMEKTWSVLKIFYDDNQISLIPPFSINNKIVGDI